LYQFYTLVIIVFGKNFVIYIQIFWKKLSCDYSWRNFFVEPLWYNNKILIQNRCVLFKIFIWEGIYNLLDDNDNFLSYEDINEKFCLKIPFTFYEGIKRAIRHSWPKVKNQISDPTSSLYNQISSKYWIRKALGQYTKCL
jgi:hypothetical protein